MEEITNYNRLTLKSYDLLYDKYLILIFDASFLLFFITGR